MIKKLLRDCVLVKLPQDTDSLVKKTSGGVLIHTLRGRKYSPTHGTVIKMSVETKYVSLNDEVFFGLHEYDNGKTRAFGNEDKRFDGHATSHDTYVIQEGTDYYMIIPEKSLYFIYRNNTIIPLNDIVICEPIEKVINTTPSGLILVDLKAEKHQENKAKVFAASPDSGLKKGDIIHTLKHCDIVVEEELNNPILPNKYFYVEYQDIVGKDD